jgi:hypothetical protein
MDILNVCILLHLVLSMSRPSTIPMLCLFSLFYTTWEIFFWEHYWGAIGRRTSSDISLAFWIFDWQKITGVEKVHGPPGMVGKWEYSPRAIKSIGIKPGKQALGSYCIVIYQCALCVCNISINSTFQVTYISYVPLTCSLQTSPSKLSGFLMA